MRNQSYWQPKGNSYPCKVDRDETQETTRLEILQEWIEADQELEAANSKQTHAKHEMAMLVAEQTAETAKAVNQGIPGVQTHTTQIRSLDAKHGVPQCCGTAHSGWRDG